MKQYKLTDASIIGTTHRGMKYNNQDASYFMYNDNLIVGIVCDGCGSSAHSEVGAQLGVRFIAAKCIELFRDSSFDVERLSKQLETYLRKLTGISSTYNTQDFVLEPIMLSGWLRLGRRNNRFSSVMITTLSGCAHTPYFRLSFVPVAN